MPVAGAVHSIRAGRQGSGFVIALTVLGINIVPARTSGRLKHKASATCPTRRDRPGYARVEFCRLLRVLTENNRCVPHIDGR